MKVAIVASLLRAVTPVSTGGTEAFAHILSEGLHKENIDVTLFATSDSVTNAELVSVCNSEQTDDTKSHTRSANIPFEILQASNVIQMSPQFDIIHNNYWHYYSLNCFSPFTQVPIITTMHNHVWHTPSLKNILVQSHQKGKDIVVFASKAVEKLANNTVDSTVIYHGIDPLDFPFSSDCDDYVLWFSRLVPNKGIKHAIDAARTGDFRLVVAGSPPIKPDNKEYIDQQITPYFSEKITYAGVPDIEKRRTLYQRAKALLFPTLLEEQFGLVMVEAMSCGTPVIAYNRGAVSEVIEDGVTGFVIDPDNEDRPGKGSWIIKKQGEEGIVEAVSRIQEIDRVACRERVITRFTRERMIREYIDLYTQISNRTR